MARRQHQFRTTTATWVKCPKGLQYKSLMGHRLTIVLHGLVIGTKCHMTYSSYNCSVCVLLGGRCASACQIQFKKLIQEVHGTTVTSIVVPSQPYSPSGKWEKRAENVGLIFPWCKKTRVSRARNKRNPRLPQSSGENCNHDTLSDLLWI